MSRACPRRARMRSHLCWLVLLLIGAAFRTASAQENLRIDSLTLARAVELGLQYHPSVRAAEANIASASGGKLLALSAYYPAVSFSASASHTEGVFVFNPSIPSRNQIYSNYSSGLSGSLLLFDFGRTASRVSASSDFLEASNQDLTAARENVIVGVQIAYFGLLEARQVSRVNEEAVQQATTHLAQAKGFYTVGRRPLFDVTKAEVDLANANVNLIRARNQEQLARLTLENAMGIHPVAAYGIEDSVEVPPMEISLDSARALAKQLRPDLLAARARYEGLRSLTTATWSQHLPTLSAAGTWNWSGFDIRLYGRWNAGLTFSLPLFQGFGITAQVEQARAAAEAGLQNLNLQVQNAMLEVEQAYLGVQEAQERIIAARKLVEQAEQNLSLAERQYAAGVGTPIDVTDALVTRANARITSIQAFFDHNSSLVRLRRALGLNP